MLVYLKKTSREEWNMAQIKWFEFFLLDKILVHKYKDLWVHEGTNLCFFLKLEF